MSDTNGMNGAAEAPEAPVKKMRGRKAAATAVDPVIEGFTLEMKERAAKETAKKADRIVITKPRFAVLAVPIIGTSPLVINAMPQKVVSQIMHTQMEGQAGKNKTKREPKDFDACYKGAMHVSRDGWLGIHAAAFRCAMIDVCRVCGVHMTKAKMSVFVVPDGYEVNGTPLVKITKGEPTMAIAPVRLPGNGKVDIRARPMWEVGWEAVVKVEVDLDQFHARDAVNLLARAGRHCGVGEGRPFSKDSNGCGWGTFEVKDSDIGVYADE